MQWHQELVGYSKALNPTHRGALELRIGQLVGLVLRRNEIFINYKRQM